MQKTPGMLVDIFKDPLHVRRTPGMLVDISKDPLHMQKTPGLLVERHFAFSAHAQNTSLLDEISDYCVPSPSLLLFGCSF